MLAFGALTKDNEIMYRTIVEVEYWKLIDWVKLLQS